MAWPVCNHRQARGDVGAPPVFYRRIVPTDNPLFDWRENNDKHSTHPRIVGLDGGATMFEVILFVGLALLALKFFSGTTESEQPTFTVTDRRPSGGHALSAFLIMIMAVLS